MRKDFATFLHSAMAADPKITLCTGDLGYGLWDQIKIDFPDRFINFFSSEQLMMGAAAGLATEGLIPVVYSITPFAIYRPFEFIRNYLDHESIPVKIVGGGRDRDYGYLGFSHWAEEDYIVMGTMNNIQFYKPEESDDDTFEEFLYNGAPSYLNLRR